MAGQKTISCTYKEVITIEEIMETGLILMWHGSIASIPAGYHLCDGTAGTPNLRDRFIVGAKQDDGGVAKTNITGSLTRSGGQTTHLHGQASGANIGGGGDYGEGTSLAAAIPPYYALAYIMKT